MFSNPPSNAQIYVLAEFPRFDNTTYYIVRGFTNVNDPSLGVVFPNYARLAIIEMTAANTLSDMVWWYFYDYLPRIKLITNFSDYPFDSIYDSLDVNLYYSDLQTDGGVTLLAESMDNSANWIGYGIKEIYGLADRTADWSDSMDLTRTALTNFTLGLNNIPEDAFYAIGQCRKIKKGAAKYDDMASAVTSDVSFDFSTISIGEDYWGLETIIYMPDGLGYHAECRVEDPADKTYLFNYADKSEQINSPVVDHSSHRPVVTWTGGDQQGPIALYWESGYVELQNNNRYYQFQVELPAGTRTYTFPELPDDLVAYNIGSWDKSYDYGHIWCGSADSTDTGGGTASRESRRIAAGVASAGRAPLTKVLGIADNRPDVFVIGNTVPELKPVRPPSSSSGFEMDEQADSLVNYSTFRLFSLADLVFQEGAPTVTSTSPENGAVDVDRNTSEITITFNEAMGPNGAFQPGGWYLDGILWSSDCQTLTFTRGDSSDPLPANTTFTLILNPSFIYYPGVIFSDYFGTPFQEDYTYSFTTGS